MAYWKQPGRVDLISDFEGNNCHLTLSFLHWGFRKNLFQFSFSVNFVFICATALDPKNSTASHVFLFALTARRLNSNLKSASSYYVRPDVQFSSVTQLCPALCNPMDCSTPDLPVYHQLPELTQTHVHWVGDAIQPSHPLLSPSPLPSNFPSIRVFSNESVLRIRWPEYWSFSFSISPSNKYSGPISFRMDWLDLLAVQGTLKSLLQAPQFISVYSSALNLLYGSNLISVHDYWKNHNFD